TSPASGGGERVCRSAFTRPSRLRASAGKQFSPIHLVPVLPSSAPKAGARQSIMARSFYHEHPDTLTLETEGIDAEPGRVRLKLSPFYPGGGGQLADLGVVRWSGGETAISGFESVGGRMWHLLADPAAELAGTVQAAVDPAFRQMMRELHTDSHI